MNEAGKPPSSKAARVMFALRFREGLDPALQRLPSALGDHCGAWVRITRTASAPFLCFTKQTDRILTPAVCFHHVGGPVPYILKAFRGHGRPPLWPGGIPERGDGTGTSARGGYLSGKISSSVEIGEDALGPGVSGKLLGHPGIHPGKKCGFQQKSPVFLGAPVKKLGGEIPEDFLPLEAAGELKIEVLHPRLSMSSTRPAAHPSVRWYSWERYLPGRSLPALSMAIALDSSAVKPDVLPAKKTHIACSAQAGIGGRRMAPA